MRRPASGLPALDQFEDRHRIGRDGLVGRDWPTLHEHRRFVAGAVHGVEEVLVGGVRRELYRRRLLACDGDGDLHV